MYIDDFIWLPDIIEKLLVKHSVLQDEVEEIFFNRPVIVSLSLDIDRAKTFTQPVGKLIQADT